MWSELVKYRHERFPIVDWAAVSVLVLLAGLSRATATDPLAVISSLVLIVLVLFQLRLFDDLVSITRDSTAHPRRILVRTSNRAFFRLWCFLLLLPVALMLYARGKLLPVVLFLGVQLCILATRYELRGVSMLALLKYPLLVFTVAKVSDAPWIEVLVPGVALWLAFVLEEYVDSDRLEDRWPFLLVLLITVIWRGLFLTS